MKKRRDERLSPLLITAQQVADLLGMSVRTVWRMTRAGTLPQPVRWSRRLVRFDRCLVEARIAELKARAKEQG